MAELLAGVRRTVFELCVPMRSVPVLGRTSRARHEYPQSLYCNTVVQNVVKQGEIFITSYDASETKKQQQRRQDRRP